MKIGLLTYFESNNYGTVLQAYALQEYLQSRGHEVEIVHIKRDVNASSKRYKAHSTIYNSFDKMRIKFNSVLNFSSEKKKTKKFSAFREQMLNVAQQFYEDDKELATNPPQYDIYMSGGDQIWNPYHKVFSTHYMWDFIQRESTIVSYGSSFGVDNINDILISECIKEWLSRYKYICVREKSGVDIVEQMGLKAKQVLDPVFLLRERWESMCKIAKTTRRYCLVYALVDYPKEEDILIKKYAKLNNLRIIIIPYNKRNCINNYVKNFDSGPVDFLNLMRNAEFVFTNSFHGIAFAILFNKQFRLLSASSEEGESKRNRLYDLLGLLGIIDGEYIDYDSVNHKLNALITESKNELGNILK